MDEKNKECKEAGIPTVVWLTPILPFISDTAGNIKNLLDACVDAGDVYKRQPWNR